MSQMNMIRFKEIATFIPKGRIIPNWVVKIVKGNKKQKCRFISNGCYVLIRSNRMWIVPQHDGEYALTITNVHNVTMTFHPYRKGKIADIICQSNYFDLVGNMPNE